jgi:hypothetical protein
MGIRLPMLDGRELKKMCVYAYVHFILSEAEKQCQEGKGQICVKQNVQARDRLLDVIKKIEDMNYTYERCQKMCVSIKNVAKYYNTVSGGVKKFFKEGDKWIPAVLGLNLLYEMQLRGHKEFEDVDFLEMIGWYELDDRSDTLTHFKCSSEILKRLYK